MSDKSGQAMGLQLREVNLIGDWVLLTSDGKFVASLNPDAEAEAWGNLIADAVTVLTWPGFRWATGVIPKGFIVCLEIQPGDKTTQKWAQADDIAQALHEAAEAIRGVKV